LDPRFEVTTETAAGALRVRAAGEIDLATAPLLAAAIDEASADGGPVLLDLSAVTFIDSTGLGVILHAHGALGERFRGMPSPACERLFDIAGVRKRLLLVEAEGAGLAGEV